jgi:hypothetical protein
MAELTTRRQRALAARLDRLTVDGKLTGWAPIVIPQGRGWVTQEPGEGRRILTTGEAEQLAETLEGIRGLQLALTI